MIFVAGQVLRTRRGAAATRPTHLRGAATATAPTASPPAFVARLGARTHHRRLLDGRRRHRATLQLRRNVPLPYQAARRSPDPFEQRPDRDAPSSSPPDPQRYRSAPDALVDSGTFLVPRPWQPRPAPRSCALVSHGKDHLLQWLVERKNLASSSPRGRSSGIGNLYASSAASRPS